MIMNCATLAGTGSEMPSPDLPWKSRLVVTKHGKPVARVLPAGRECAELIGSMKEKIRIKGDILSTGLKWDAES